MTRLYDILDHLELLPILPAQPGHQVSLRERMARLNVPGVSVAVLTPEGKLMQATFGEGAAGLPVGQETLFQAGSISKPIAALAVLRLVATGELHLDEDVNTYLRSWSVPKNGSWRPRLTLRHLLSHTAGTTVHGFPGYRSGTPVPSLVQVLEGELPANTEPVRVTLIPGTRHQYSGGGMAIVQCLLQDVVGAPFDVLMRELVLEPLDMHNSTYAQPLMGQRMSAAHGYRVGGGEVTGGAHVYPEQAAAGLWSTPSELVQVIRMLHEAASMCQETFLPGWLVNEMLDVRIPPFGLGFMVANGDGNRRLHHSGKNEGFVSDFHAYIQEGCGVVVMTNSDAGRKLIGPIVRAVAHEYRWLDLLPPVPITAYVDPAELTSLQGTYTFETDLTLDVHTQGNSLIISVAGQSPLEFSRLENGTFFSRQVNARLTFTSGGGSQQVQLTQIDKKLIGRKIRT